MEKRRGVVAFIALCWILGGLSAFTTVAPARAQGVRGASLYLSPATGTFTVGSTFNVSVVLNTGGSFINAVELMLRFPPDKLQIVSPSTGKSFIEVWANTPQFSNRDGTATFQGGVHRPGINTSDGVVTTITFRVRETGTANIRIQDSSRVFLADGSGSDILSTTGSGIYDFVLPPPAGPIVTSPTHPNQLEWSGAATTVLRWQAPPDMQGFSYSLSRDPLEEPDNISEGARTSVTYENLGDGSYYFHVKALRGGAWGGVTHYGLKIDRTPPATFDVDVSPGEYTSSHQPIFAFQSTDQTSGVEYYELKVLRLNPSVPSDETPFFIEVTSPYTESLDFGKYEVIVRAYDFAKNFTESSKRIVIANPVFEIIRDEGLRLFNEITLPWPFVILIAALLLVIFGYVARALWILHRKMEVRLELGAMRHPHIEEKLNTLREKQAEYRKPPSSVQHMAILIAFFISLMVFATTFAHAQSEVPFEVDPPIITLFPDTLSNDEIFYIGGRAAAPHAEVIVNLQDTMRGDARTFTAETDENGAWFYSLSEFLPSGTYQAWTQLKVGEELSRPSPLFTVLVAPTAIQFGGTRVSFQSLYLIFTVMFGIAFLALLGFIGYHFRHLRIKRKKFTEEIREAEASIHRGFALLRRDIEDELALVHTVKLGKTLTEEERRREEKLVKDLELVRNVIGKEVWEIEETERQL